MGSNPCQGAALPLCPGNLAFGTKAAKGDQNCPPPFDGRCRPPDHAAPADGLGYAHKQGTYPPGHEACQCYVEGDFAAGKIKIKILDFGIARTMSTDFLTKTSQGLGTAYYISPGTEKQSPCG